jgi:hypothetical protein
LHRLILRPAPRPTSSVATARMPRAPGRLWRRRGARAEHLGPGTCYPLVMRTSAADLREWVRQRRLAEARGKAETLDRAPAPSQALSRGLALIAFAQAAVGCVTSAAAGVSPQDLLAYRRWARVRAALRVA